MHLAGLTPLVLCMGLGTAFSTAVKNAKGLTNLRLFHEVNDDDSVVLARKFVPLVWTKGKSLNSLNYLRYRFATTTDKPASMLPPTEDK